MCAVNEMRMLKRHHFQVLDHLCIASIERANVLTLSKSLPFFEHALYMSDFSNASTWRCEYRYWCEQVPKTAPAHPNAHKNLRIAFT